MSPVTRREREDTFERLAESFEQAPAVGIAWAQRAMAARPDRLEVLRRLHVPALVLRGEDNSVSSPAQAAVMAEAIGTSVVVVPKAGHMAAFENPEPVARALADLWERARASAEGS